MPRFCLLCSLICLALCGLKAQGPRISGNFQQAFPAFVTQIESTTPYRFFYRPSDADSLVVNATVTDVTLEALLQQVLRNTGFSFAIDAQQRVYIVKGTALVTALPAQFFDVNAKEAPFAVAATQAKEKPAAQKIVASLENKLIVIGSPSAGRGKVTLSGYVRDIRNGEPIPGAAIAVDSLTTGVSTNQFGYYTITVAAGRHRIWVNSIGMKSTSRQVLLHDNGALNIELAEYVPSLKEVVVTSNRLSNVRSLSMGKDRLTIQTIKQIPVVFGEADVLRAVMALPGVTSVGENSTGLNVRGGAADQNLIMLNDATIYNPSHLFGFFSSFNPDMIKGVELYKSAIPEKYGGRLSSVLDVTTRQGNTKKLTGNVGIGPLTSKMMLEGPLVKEKMTFVASARSSYSNWLMRFVPDETYKNSRAFFYDANLHLTYNPNTRNSFFINGYISQDRFRLNGDTTYRYGNKNINLKWKHLFNTRLHGLFTAGIDDYQFDISSLSNPVNAYKLNFAIGQRYLRADFNYTPNLKHNISFGLNSIYYSLQPGALRPVGNGSLVKPNLLNQEQAFESALYLGDDVTVSNRLSVHAGLRFSMFNYLGPQTQFTYEPGLPRTKNGVLDTLQFGSGKLIKTYTNPELRVSMRYTLSDNSSVKFSFNTTAQYLHTLTNTNAISPIDVRKLSDAYLRPQTGWQASAGFYRNFQSNAIETSLEVYYKRMRNYLDFRSGADLLLNSQIETDVIATEGKAYGAELLLKKNSGKLTGWLSYAYSRILLQSNDPFSVEQINEGRYYPANFDKPHNTNFTGNYKFSHRYSMSLGANYSTGRPITLPLAVFNFGGAQRVYYSERNQYRVPDYFRADLSFMIEGNHKTTKATHNTWTFGVYNLSGRRNVYSVFFVQEAGQVKGYELSIFGAPIPFVTYTLRF